MNAKWKTLNSIDQLQEIISASEVKPVVLFKHSTRCSISSMALNRLQNLDDAFYDKVDFYYLDLIAFREVSNAIASKLDVYHESPQVIFVKNRECIYDASHMEISPKELYEFL